MVFFLRMASHQNHPKSKKRFRAKVSFSTVCVGFSLRWPRMCHLIVPKSEGCANGCQDQEPNCVFWCFWRFFKRNLIKEWPVTKIQIRLTDFGKGISREAGSNGMVLFYCFSIRICALIIMSSFPLVLGVLELCFCFFTFLLLATVSQYVHASSFFHFS